MKRSLLIVACLLIGGPVFADTPQARKPQQSKGRARPCQDRDPQRTVWPQGTLLWGTARKVASEETSSVLVSVDVGRVMAGGRGLKGVRVEGGHLVALSPGSERLVGAVLQGTASDGHPVEVALCGAEPVARDPTMVWYRLEIWNARSASWENPCVATHRVPTPRALAVRGIWDGRGTHHEDPERFTFACENGAIARCIDWGYKPWVQKEGRSLADLHQACTRMARADYCGDGRSSTRQDTLIDMYDGLKVLTRTTESTQGWKPERASFEAAWTPEGAWCLSHTRDGRTVETVLARCPGRFVVGEKDLGEGDRCTVHRTEGRAEEALLRNRSYTRNGQSLLPGADP